MTIARYNLAQDTINTEVLTKTNYEITSATAAQERNINSFASIHSFYYRGVMVKEQTGK